MSRSAAPHSAADGGDRLYMPFSQGVGLALILLGYGVLVLLFALFTPAWQAPDEPAHYTYIMHLATGQGLPVLQMGDYDQAYLSLLISNRFPAELSITPLRYEFHQPPLYYLIALPVFWLSQGSLVALRLFNGLLGAGLLLLLYLGGNLVFPARPLIVLGAVAFAAFLPMHVALLSAVNNDVLAELLIAAAVLQLLHWMREQAEAPRAAVAGRGRLLRLGLLVGLGLVTKSTTYILLPIGVVAVVAVQLSHLGGWRRPAEELGWALRRLGGALLAFLLPALAVGMPLWIRNSLLYGGFDFLGLAWHDQVVVGQPRTADWIAAVGWTPYWERAVEYTFKSFWGVFGWLGVFMDGRIYTALLLFTGVIWFGLLWAGVRLVLGSPDAELSRFQKQALGLLVLLGSAAVGGYLWYNLKFVQHQGRYLFPGLFALSLFTALAWREVMQVAQGAVTGTLMAILALAQLATAPINPSLDRWLIFFALAGAALLLGQALLAHLAAGAMPFLPPALNRLLARPSVRRLLYWACCGLWATPYLLLFLLDLAIPWTFLVPNLAR